MTQPNRKRMALLFVAFTAFPLIVGAGCSHTVQSVRKYSGPPRDASQIAQLIVPAPTFIENLDGVRGVSNRRMFNVVELEPGTHKLTVRLGGRTLNVGVKIVRGVANGMTRKENEFEFNAASDTVYIVATHNINAFEPAFGLMGPYPRRVEIPGTATIVELARRPGLPAEADTDHLVYIVESGSKRTVYDPFHTTQYYPGYSADGHHVAFTNKIGRYDYQIVVDGVPLPHHFERLLSDISFSPDGARYFFAARRQGKNCIVENGRIDAREDFSRFYGYTIKFSPDSRHLAFVAILRDGKQYLFLDGKKHGPYRRVDFRSLKFAPDSNTFEYAVELEADAGFLPKRIALAPAQPPSVQPLPPPSAETETPAPVSIITP